MDISKAQWLQAEPNFNSAHFKPTTEEREQLLSYLDAWDKAMAEQEKLMPMVDRLVATGDIAQIEAAARWMNNSGHAGRYHLIREWRRLSEAPAANGEAAKVTIKIKGKSVEINGAVVGSIHGWRNPNGKDHVPYEVRLLNGQNIGQFAYADDARKWCRDHAATLGKLVSDNAFNVKAALSLP